MNKNVATVRLLLSAAASEALSAAGPDCFAVVSRAMQADPAEAGRWVIHLAPVSMPTAKAACDVLLGTHRAVRIPQPKAASRACAGSEDLGPASPTPKNNG